MPMYGRVVGAAGALMLLGSQALAVAPTHAQSRSDSKDSLTTKIAKTYPWAHPRYTAATYDGKQFNLFLYETGKPQDLSQGLGARLMSLYLAELPGQGSYKMLSYVFVPNHTALNDWEYVYTTANHRLRRYRSDTKGLVLTTWYLTVGQIAQAAKSGHWPAPAKS